MTEPYREDLAHIHDAGFGALARHGAEALLAALARRRITSGLVIDLGCGSGILSEAVASAGYDVLGIDLSGPMLDLARKRVPTATFRQESVLTAELPPCVAACAVGEVFNYLFDPRNGKSTLGKLLRRIHRALAPQGVLLLDVAGPERFLPHRRQLHREGDGWVVLVDAEVDDRRKVLTRRITSFRRDGDLYRRAEETHRQRLYSPEEIEELLQSAGFRARRLRRYGSFRLPRGLAGFLARKTIG
jgi:SAM-dependent methyltransferase